MWDSGVEPDVSVEERRTEKRDWEGEVERREGRREKGGHSPQAPEE